MAQKMNSSRTSANEPHRTMAAVLIIFVKYV